MSDIYHVDIHLFNLHKAYMYTQKHTHTHKKYKHITYILYIFVYIHIINIKQSTHKVAVLSLVVFVHKLKRPKPFVCDL